MEPRRWPIALLAGCGIAALMATGPAIAQQEEACARRLDRIEQQLSQVEVEAQRQSDLKEVIEGARLLADTGDRDGCMTVAAELDQVMATLDESRRPPTPRGGERKPATE